MTSLSIHSIKASFERLKGHLPATPVTKLSIPSHTDKVIYLKGEHLQKTGSFKIRGALNKLLLLKEQGYVGSVITASTGNHGLAMAMAGQIAKIPVVIIVPENISPDKALKLSSLGADVVVFGNECLESEKEARRRAIEKGDIYVSPYNDFDVIAGQGTIGVELSLQLKKIDRVFASVGGGGLISGIAFWLKSVNPDIEIIGCLPENSAAMPAAVEAGKVIEVPHLPTLSDGTAGGLEDNAITVDLCRKLIDRYVLVSENKIAAAMKKIYGFKQIKIEGAAGVAMAALLNSNLEPGLVDVVIVCGGNISDPTFKEIITR